MLVRLQTVASRSRVKHSTTELPEKQVIPVDIYLIFSLPIYSTVCTLHGVTSIYTYLSPYDYSSCRLLGFLYQETTVGKGK